MRRLKRPAIALALALALALAASALFALRYSHAAAWRLSDEERVWVERTLAAATEMSGTTREELERTTRPRLWNRPGELCVSLLTHRSDGGGSHQACFDRESGHLVEQREYGGCLCAEPLTDPLWALVW